MVNPAGAAARTPSDPVRVAWTGVPPMDTGSITYVATQLLERLPDLGVHVDCYAAWNPDVVPERLRSKPGLRFFFKEPKYRPGRWYSRDKITGFVIGQSERVLLQGVLADRIRRNHAVTPYDCVYQLSQLELFALRLFHRRLPPLVVHPGTHAAGELRWLRRERPIAAEVETPRREITARAMMRARAEIQLRDIHLAQMVVAISSTFAQHLVEDYGVPAKRIVVVPNPVDLDRHTPIASSDEAAPSPQRILFVSRMAVRKGVENVVRLSHDLGDLTGQVRLHLIGDHSSWSDYRRLLTGLNPQIASYEGYIPEDTLARLYREAAMVVLPSHFEPFGLTLSEALATGIPVVASDAVGSIEGIDPLVCRTFPDGDAHAFEQAVRRLLADMRDHGVRAQIRRVARAEAERAFSPDHVAQSLAQALHALRAGAFGKGDTAPLTRASWT